MKLFNCTFFISILAVVGASSVLLANVSVARTNEDKANSKRVSEAILCIGHKKSVDKADQSSPAPAASTEPIDNLKNSAHVAEGRMLFYDRGCIVCHTVRNMGGHIAPSLDGMSKRHNRQYVASRIADAEYILKLKKNSGVSSAYAMPPSGLTKEQSASVADYLMTLP